MTAQDNDDETNIFSEEEKSILDSLANKRQALADETVLCHKMTLLVQLAHERRRDLIASKRYPEDICAYDYRLDTVLARAAFEAFIATPDGQAILDNNVMGDPPVPEGGISAGPTMCERKKCKIHTGWYKMLLAGVKHQVKEAAAQGSELMAQENIMRDAARERWWRKKSENNWVEIL